MSRIAEQYYNPYDSLTAAEQYRMMMQADIDNQRWELHEAEQDLLQGISEEVNICVINGEVIEDKQVLITQTF